MGGRLCRTGGPGTRGARPHNLLHLPPVPPLRPPDPLVREHSGGELPGPARPLLRVHADQPALPAVELITAGLFAFAACTTA